MLKRILTRLRRAGRRLQPIALPDYGDRRNGLQHTTTVPMIGER